MAARFVMPVDAETMERTLELNAELERLRTSRPAVYDVPIEETRRRLRAEGLVHLPQARELTIPGRAGAIPVRVLAPEGTPTGVYLHFHGGGWVFGGADMQDPVLGELAEATGMCVLSVDYRLAPEHPYPAAPDDCEDVARWLVDGGAGQVGAPDRLAIGGESAGAHLAAVTLLRLRDRHGIAGAFRAANLVYGVYDLSMTPSVRLWHGAAGAADKALTWVTDTILPGTDRESWRDPEISPLFADLAGMPPALFTVGTRDHLLDDTLFMEARWWAAGHATGLRVWPEAVHGFDLHPGPMSVAAHEEMYAFLRAAPQS